MEKDTIRVGEFICVNCLVDCHWSVSCSLWLLAPQGGAVAVYTVNGSSMGGFFSPVWLHHRLPSWDPRFQSAESIACASLKSCHIIRVSKRRGIKRLFFEMLLKQEAVSWKRCSGPGFCPWRKIVQRIVGPNDMACVLERVGLLQVRPSKAPFARFRS